MNRKRVVSVLLVAALGAVPAWSAVITVAKSGGMFNSIQAAVDASRPGDEIVINDLGVYEEQVTIDSTKKDLILRSKSPLSINKPVIKWLDEENVGPKTCAEAADLSKITYMKNGALRLIRANGVTIDGIAIDGSSPNPFAYTGIWNCKDELFHGNTALLLHTSGSVKVRNCEVRNAFYGIHLTDLTGNISSVSGSGLLNVGTGNHIIEHNRIHDNSWGMYAQSVHGLGSTVRYNLIYSNFHTVATLSKLSSLPGKDHQPGGAFIFMDVSLTPMAFHNNTFWDNYLIFSGHWKPGGQHLVFNNINGKPKYYWGTGYPSGPKYTDPWHAMDAKCFIQRTKHCLYTAQKSAPQTRSQAYYIMCTNDQVDISGVAQVTISNDIQDASVAKEGKSVDIACPDGSVTVQFVNWIKNPGALISSATGPFPATAEVRWLETTFLSTDPDSPDFLKPDWSSSEAQSFIKNKGWESSGIVNADGLTADIGAVPSGEFSDGKVIINPVGMVKYANNSAELNFSLENETVVSDLKVAYLNLVNNIPVQSNGAFAATMVPVSASNIHNLAKPSTNLLPGENKLQVSLPDTLGEYAFIEMIVTGKNSEGKSVISNVGFFPYRKNFYEFSIELTNVSTSLPTNRITAGEPLVVKVTPKFGGEDYLQTVKSVRLSLSTGESWSFDSLKGVLLDTVVFTKSGEQSVIASGQILDDSLKQIPFFGTTPVYVEWAEASNLIFTDPASVKRGGAPSVFEPESKAKFNLVITDRFENVIPIDYLKINLESLNPEIADIDGETELFGWGRDTLYFYVNVKTTELGVPFSIVATCDSLQTSDTVVCVTGGDISPVVNGKMAGRSELVRVELIDLKGRMVDKYTGHMEEYAGHLRSLQRPVQTRGIYLMRVTELKSGRRYTKRLSGLSGLNRIDRNWK